jgi:hypothetical protein
LNSGNGKEAYVGFVGVTKAIGEIIIPPVSVCHHVSTTGHFISYVVVVPVPSFLIDGFSH